MIQHGIEQKMLQDIAKFKPGENLVLLPSLSSCQHVQSVKSQQQEQQQLQQQPVALQQCSQAEQQAFNADSDSAWRT